MIKFICISGKAQHGKDTTASILYNQLTESGKKVVLVHYADLLKFICKEYFGWNGEKDDTGRTLLQKVGTDVIRKQEPDYWVDFILKIVSFFNNEWDYIIIPDTRFPNELNKITENGYHLIHIRVIRPEFESSLTVEQQQHISEIALDNVEPDIEVFNRGTIEELIRVVQDVTNFILNN